MLSLVTQLLPDRVVIHSAVRSYPRRSTGQVQAAQRTVLGFPLGILQKQVTGTVGAIIGCDGSDVHEADPVIQSKVAQPGWSIFHSVLRILLRLASNSGRRHLAVFCISQ